MGYCHRDNPEQGKEVSPKNVEDLKVNVGELAKEVEDMSTTNFQKNKIEHNSTNNVIVSLLKDSNDSEHQNNMANGTLPKELGNLQIHKELNCVSNSLPSIDQLHDLNGNVDSSQELKQESLGIEQKCEIASQMSSVAFDKEQEKSAFDLSVNDFNFIKLIGKGAFGDVFLVRKKHGVDAGQTYALKMVYKAKVKEDKMYEINFKSEREALEIVRDGIFLSRLYYAFQSPGHLFIVMDYNSGGQLLNQFIGKNVLLIKEVKFYICELLVAVDYLHKRGIIHRDIKPENVLLDIAGHIVLIDYGLSKHDNGTPNESYVGTEPYIAPEILQRKTHDRMADFWSIGVLGYEMLAGQPPFDLSLTTEQMNRAVVKQEVRYDPKVFQKLFKSLLVGLLQKCPRSRLGAITKGNKGGMEAVMNHKFFKSVNWQEVRQRKFKPPLIPEAEDISGRKERPFKEPKFDDYRNHFDGYEYSWEACSES